MPVIDEESTRIAERGRRLVNQVFALELEAFRTDGEKQAVESFVRRSAEIASFLMQHGGDADALASLETDEIRALAVDVRRYSLRRHLTFCAPAWGIPSRPRPNQLAAFGSAGFEASVATLARPLRLALADGNGAGTPDRLRWERVCSSNFALFDFRGDARDEGLWAGNSHALGLAFSVGTLPVILTDDASGLPFDVDVEAVHVPASAQAGPILSEAMAAAAVAQFDVGAGANVRDTIDYVLRHAVGGSAAGRYMRPFLEEIRDSETPDPENARRYLQSLLSAAGTKDLALLTPLWSATYPDPDAGECFHVLPFRLPDQVSKAVEAGCSPTLAYRRGDTTGELDIIEGIWNGIGRASHVVVDLTPVDPAGKPADAMPNPNVCLELAMAQALGRQLLLVRHEGAKDAPLFPGIAKLQVLPYENAQALTDLVEAFVQGDPRGGD